MNTDTPLTDAATAKCHGMPAGYPGRFVSIDFARALERRLTKINGWLDQTAHELKLVTSERDDLRERLAEILAPIAAPPESAEIINENFFDLIAPSKCKCGKTTALNHPTLCEKHMHDLDS